MGPKLSQKPEDRKVMGSEPRGQVEVREGPLKKESRRAGTPLPFMGTRVKPGDCPLSLHPVGCTLPSGAPL